MNGKKIYRVIETKSYKKSLQTDGNLYLYLPPIQEFVELSPYDPFQGDVEKMKGTKNMYKKRFGDPWKLLFTIDKKDKIVELLKVLLRENAY
ncbi:hypothetical protein CDAR_183141 [Caerostris darwini]|uniref:LAGLIDADG homing endonuclease n=1 Tax=Caerostris darwini TaxID=1538125 RepID=A0AAV4T6Y8_9ARAC|nr:hypothetical protein CDAR_183141 [Caerostris darwini]